MTQARKDELLMAMKDLRNTGNEEHEHAQGDALVSLALRELGFPELSDAFDSQRKEWWYS